MGASGNNRRKRVRGVLPAAATVIAVVGLDSLMASTSGASSRQVLGVATTSSSGPVLLALGGAVLVLGIIGFVVFTYVRRKRKPDQCAEERDALELAEKAVKYWEAARAHFDAVERGPTALRSDDEDATHAALVAKAVEGLSTAMRQRDDRQLALFRCMATGVPGVPVTSATQVPAQPFFTPETGGPSSSDTPGPR
jgi:hypothetical protein